MFRQPLRVLLGVLVAASPAPVRGQENDPPPQPPAIPVQTAPPGWGDTQQLLERLGKLEKGFDGLKQQDDSLRRENQELKEKLGVSIPDLPSPGLPAVTPNPDVWTGVLESSASQPPDTSGQSGSTGDGSRMRSQPAQGGGSKVGGGDPTTIGRAQEVGYLGLGKVGANPYYDFDDGGFHVATPDGSGSSVSPG
jgi:hypothetical protein